MEQLPRMCFTPLSLVLKRNGTKIFGKCFKFFKKPVFCGAKTKLLIKKNSDWLLNEQLQQSPLSPIGKVVKASFKNLRMLKT